MDPKEACLQVLAQAPGETLHWTVVLDRALTQRLIDPFTTSDVRGVVVEEPRGPRQGGPRGQAGRRPVPGPPGLS